MRVQPSLQKRGRLFNDEKIQLRPSKPYMGMVGDPGYERKYKHARSVWLLDHDAAWIAFAQVRWTIRHNGMAIVGAPFVGRNW